MRRLLPLYTLLAAATLAAPATAAPTKWSEGEVLHTQGFNCASIIFNNPRLELQTFAYASQQVPANDLPHAGDVFYVRVTFGSIGDICGGGGRLLPEFVPPAGAELVPRDRRHPPYWTAFEDDREQRGSDPVKVLPSANGRTAQVLAHPQGEDAQPWPYANSGAFLSVHLAMRARRRLNGIGTPPPTCAERENGLPCPPDRSGDHLQVVAQVADGGAPGTLIPYVGLFAREPRPPVLKAPRRPRARGFALTARTAPRFKVRVRFGGRSRTVVANARGIARLRLRGRPGRTRVRALAIADDGSVSRDAKRTLRLR